MRQRWYTASSQQITFEQFVRGRFCRVIAGVLAFLMTLYGLPIDAAIAQQPASILYANTSDASLGNTSVVFGPKDFLRGKGKPVQETWTFTVTNLQCAPTLRIDNGGQHGQFARVSSAVITLNGVQVVAPSEFNETVEVIEKPVPLASSNVLSVELRSKPASGLTLQLLCANAPPVADAGPDQTVVVGQTVQLDGSESTDADGDELDFAWSVVNKPAGSAAVLIPLANPFSP